MSFGEAIQTVFRKYAEFMGRAGRAEFWWWALFTVLVASALNLFDVIRIGDNGNLGSLLAGLWGIAILLPSLAVAVRRLRDSGYSWGYLFFILVPIAGDLRAHRPLGAAYERDGTAAATAARPDHVAVVRSSEAHPKAPSRRSEHVLIGGRRLDGRR